MMHCSLGIESLLANLLLKDPSPVSLAELNEVRDRIRRNSRQPVYIDTSPDAVYAATEDWPQMFEFVADRIVRAKNADQFFTNAFVRTHFGPSIQYKNPKTDPFQRTPTES